MGSLLKTFYDLNEYLKKDMEIEEKFDVRSTFFFRTLYENGDVLDYEDDIKQLQKSNWEIGLHTDPSSVDNTEKIQQEKTWFVIDKIDRF